ncbi:mechanosensitive ion channel domain-containing protein [Pelagibacterium montanilacus]|uniref:mechanosensitive ion channel domain-containing protein n=1 Tax=Pelagibacterium montanilacus TaxID=2185280 RepID=UPI000F8D120B|nr:mechanosensitive ion channel domain-containing protein [Pelagibacterium montanilacus]
MASVFRPLLVALLVLFPLLVSGAAFAQTQGEPPAEETPSALSNLLEVLRDDAARAELIDKLEQAVEGGGDAGAPAEEDGLLPDELRSIGAQVADATQWAAESVAQGASSFVEQISAAPAIFSALTFADIVAVGGIIANLLALILITHGGFLAVRAFTDRLRMRIRMDSAGEGLIAKTIAVVLSLLVDLVASVAPWALGYVVALLLLGTPGDISFEHSLYLNAFLVIELVLALLRAVFSPRRGDTRLVALTDKQARSSMRWSRLFVSLFVYGQFLLMPLFSRTISAGAGRALSVAGLLLILALTAIAVLRARKAISKMVIRRRAGRKPSKATRLLLRFWHIPVMIYIAGLAITAMANPVEDFYVVLLANLQVAVAVLVGMMVSNALSKLIGGGIHLPEHLSQRVPLLERRLNSFVPRILTVLRFAVVGAVIIFCLHTLGAFNFVTFLESQFGARVTGAVITVSIILLVTFALWLVLNSWVDYRINPDFALSVSSRERTLLTLMRNALTIALIVIALMFVLSEIGINIAPLLASAGVIGLAVGFGAQKLVQDIITGIFIQLEGAIDVGDVVAIGGISGVVERLTIRSASLRDLEGSYHIIPFSSVDTVTNFMRGFSYALLDMGVAYREDVDEVKKAMHDAFDKLKADPEHGKNIIGELEWMGLNSFGASEIVVRARIKSLPGTQWGLKRAYNGIVKRIFDERDIEIPFPHQTVYFGVDKSGNAPPMHVQPEPGPEGGGADGLIVQGEAKPADAPGREDGAPPEAGTKSGRTPRAPETAAKSAAKSAAAKSAATKSTGTAAKPRRRRKTEDTQPVDLPDPDAGPDDD